MSRDNIGWGAPRIHGELQMLGIHISQATVAKYMIHHREQPPAKAGGFGLRLKAGSIGPSADYRHTTVKSSSGSGGC
jgi:hypothetical protein